MPNFIAIRFETTESYRLRHGYFPAILVKLAYNWQTKTSFKSIFLSLIYSTSSVIGITHYY